MNMKKKKTNLLSQDNNLTKQWFKSYIKYIKYTNSYQLNISESSPTDFILWFLSVLMVVKYPVGLKGQFCMKFTEFDEIA